tara:strand:+ start:804 stop:2465 length:1662 start_codon:yes stop_codon:yes gene_type:complete
MSLSNIGPLGFTLGLLGIAGALAALQVLRVRHDRVPVVTTLFWKEAVDEARARELWQRFRHPLAYLMALAIGLLAWLALAGPESDARPASDLVLVLDASRQQSTEDHVADLDALIARAKSEPRKATTVIWCGARTETLLAPQESIALLEPRLADHTPDGAESKLSHLLTELARSQPADRELNIVIHGPTRIASDALASLPAHVHVFRDGAQVDAKPAITKLGITPAASGRWDAVDVLVAARGGEPSVTRNGTAMTEGERSPKVSPDGMHSVQYRDVPADGSLLVATLANEPRARAERHLPLQRILSVDLDPSVGAILSAVLTADPAVTLSGGAPDVRVGGAGTPGPAMRVVSADDQGPAILVEIGPDEDPDQSLAEILGEFGLDRVDANLLATELGRPLAIEVQVGEARSVAFWSDLLDPARCSFTQGRAFPVMIGRSLRWLAGIDAYPAEIAVGEPVLGGHGVMVDPDEAQVDALGSAYVPDAPGDARHASGDLWSASFLVHGASNGPRSDAVLDGATAAAGAGTSIVFWVLLFALALLLFEWRLVRTGRMP